MVHKTGEGVILDIVLGVVSAVVGGGLFSMFGVTRIGAVLVLVLYGGRRQV